MLFSFILMIIAIAVLVFYESLFTDRGIVEVPPTEQLYEPIKRKSVWEGALLDACSMGNWYREGTCSEHGKIKEVRSVYGGCSDDVERERYVDCCYTTDWIDTSECTANGLKSQSRTVKACNPTIKSTRQIDCCYLTDWVNEGECSSIGKMKQVRTATGKSCDNAITTKYVPCCYTTDWQDWTVCINGKKTQRRQVVGCDSSYKNVREIDCTDEI